jgi:hypothetical protein
MSGERRLIRRFLAATRRKDYTLGDLRKLAQEAEKVGELASLLAVHCETMVKQGKLSERLSRSAADREERELRKATMQHDALEIVYKLRELDRYLDS